jgi:hypothetical protein
MNRRVAMALLFLAIGGFPQICFAQSDPWLGLWQLNLAKSKFTPASPYKSLTVYRSQVEGQNVKVTEVGIKPVFPRIPGSHRRWEAASSDRLSHY